MVYDTIMRVLISYFKLVIVPKLFSNSQMSLEIVLYFYAFSSVPTHAHCTPPPARYV